MLFVLCTKINGRAIISIYLLFNIMQSFAFKLQFVGRHLWTSQSFSAIFFAVWCGVRTVYVIFVGHDDLYLTLYRLSCEAVKRRRWAHTCCKSVRLNSNADKKWRPAWIKETSQCEDNLSSTTPAGCGLWDHCWLRFSVSYLYECICIYKCFQPVLLRINGTPSLIF